MNDGRPPETEQAVAAAATKFKAFRERYVETHRQGSLESNSLATVETHLAHFERTLGEGFAGLMARQKPRRLLFVIHPPVVPYNARGTWHVYSAPRKARERERLLELLGAARAVVLCGHLHKYSFLIRRTARGRFAQLALSSVGNTTGAKPRYLIESVKDCTPELVKLEPRHAPATEARRRQLLEQERPFIEHFEYADTWGHALVRVRGDRVQAAVFLGLERHAWKNLNLTSALDQRE